MADRDFSTAISKIKVPRLIWTKSGTGCLHLVVSPKK